MMKKISKEYRGIAVEPSFWDLKERGLNPEELVKTAKEMNCNAIRVGFFGHVGTAYFQSQIAPHAPGLGERDLYVEFKEACDKYGITLVPYVNTHFDKAYYEQHPEAISILDGKDGIVPGTPLVKVCLNNPAYREYTFSVARELVEMFQPPILYIDSLKLEHLCTCEWCQKLFKEASGGMSIPLEEDWGGENWQCYIDWYQNHYDELSRICVENARLVKPDLETISNRESFFNQITSTPEFNSRLANTLFSEIHAEAALRMSAETYSHITQQCMFGQAMNTEIWLWVEYIMGHWMHHSPCDSEMVFKLAKVISGGGRPNLWTLTDTSGEFTHCGSEGVKRIYGMMEKHPDVFNYTERFADVAQLYSTISRQFYVKGLEPFAWPYTPDGASLHYQKEFEGMFKMGLFSHQLSTFILDGDLNLESLNKYKVLILPSCGCIRDEHCEAIREFVCNGGTILATGETSLYDDNGKRRENFKLADVFGCDFVDDGYSAGDFESFHVGGYLCPTAENPLKMPSNALASGKTLNVKPTTGTVAANFVYPGWYHLDFNRREKDTPGIICNQYGNGKAIFLPFEFGFGFACECPPPMIDFFNLCIEYLRNNLISVETNLPATGDVFIRRTADNDFVVHLINLPYDKASINKTIPPLHDVWVKLNIPELAEKSNYQVVSEDKPQITFKRQEDTLMIKIPVLKDYTVIKIL